MTDKELLTAAARAAGHTVPWFEAHSGQMREWNPLTDDGDALRLAVKLGIDLKFAAGATWVKLREEDGALDLDIVRHGDDQYKATRLAIVRAAAALDSGHNA